MSESIAHNLTPIGETSDDLGKVSAVEPTDWSNVRFLAVDRRNRKPHELLEASGNSIKAYNEGVGLITTQTVADMRQHDFSFAMGGEGLTVHSSYETPRQVRDRLEAHVEARKYVCKANRWLGLFVDPADGLPLVGFALKFLWVYDPLRAELARDLPLDARSRIPKTLESFQRTRTRRKLGRNDPYFFGSGRKYKKCCGP